MAKVVLLKLVKYGNTENIDMVEYGRNGSKIDKIWVLKNMTKSTPKGAFHYLATLYIIMDVFVAFGITFPDIFYTFLITPVWK